ncbi:TetR family transcriptional regulator C-terminal domain-containing protein [Roseomonas sp. 18066]|uniref:TetR family transcriptional regulator C-terminal domain-containing protein n=1 Tax=Roseomonas sp. 18066 TaxID=2681412 RepID=UPI001359B403|nr:TetR family transcriptional regulator C-terminal domain-containing protein [Roseomonas sp. 18066]
MQQPAPGRRAQQRQQRLAQILGAAEQIFATSGFEGASMAAIAAEAGLPKANLHYYFGTKEALYAALLEDLLRLWLSATDAIRPDSEPAAALEGYIRAKMAWSRSRPHASKLFANEVLRGAPLLAAHLSGGLRALVEEKAAVLRGWMAEGRMAVVEPRHLFFAIWAMTQTYADFDTQIRLVLDVPALGDREFDDGVATVLRLVLGGCFADSARQHG